MLLEKKAWKLIEKAIILPGFEPEMVYLSFFFLVLVLLFLAVLLAVGFVLCFTSSTTFPPCILSVCFYLTVEREAFLFNVRKI
jgi:hypothetical protein